jgi:hemolysin activation/secretion protein
MAPATRRHAHAATARDDDVAPAKPLDVAPARLNIGDSCGSRRISRGKNRASAFNEADTIDRITFQTRNKTAVMGSISQHAARRIVPRRRRGTFIRAGALLAAMPGLAHAQAYARIAPLALPNNPPPSLAMPGPAAPPPQSAAPLLPALRGVAYLPSAAALQPAGLAPASLPGNRIATAGLPLLARPDFTAEIAPLLGRPISFASLAALQRDAQLWYAAHGRPFVDVTLPPQNIQTGVVQIIVTEYHVGAVTVSGNRWFAASLIARESGLAPGDDLSLDHLRDSLAFLNANPFRTVSIVFAPGAATGATDVNLNVTDRLPLHLYASFDDQGVPSLGRDEWSAGATWGNAFGQDQVLSYQFTRGDLNRYTAHALNWTIPLPGHVRLLIFGAYARERPDLGPFFNETGQSGQASLRIVLPLPDLTPAPNIRLTQDLQLGYDFKTSNNDLEFGGVKIFASAAEIDQFPLIYDATETDPHGQTQFTGALFASPGNLTAGNRQAAFTADAPGARPRYLYGNAALTRVTFLPAGFSLTTRALGQAASGNLLYSEQLGLGGAGSVRGYVTDAALGSDGILLSQEIRAPAFSLTRLLRLRGAGRDNEQIGAFWDYGHAGQVTDAPKATDLASLGLDLHAGLAGNVSLSFDIGWQLRRAPGAAKRGAFTDVAAVIGY